MKKLKLFIAAAALVSFMACNPIEDLSLREQYVVKAGTPITSAELTSALTVAQEGATNDIVTLKNNRTDVGGAWHVGTAMGETIIKNDQYTYTYEANGEFEIYYVGISEGKIVESAHFPVVVTDVYDPWAGMLTGAKSNTDKSAKKTWSWREVSWGSICNMGAHGGWKYASAGYTPESNFAWWANFTLADVDVTKEKMVFEYDGSKMTTYGPDGSVAAQGTFGFIKTSPEEAVLGTWVTTAPLIGARFDDCGQGSNNQFYLLTFTDKFITIYHNGWDGSADWDDCGWYAYFEAQ